MLPQPQTDTYFPYIQNGSCRFNDNIIVVHADRIKKEPNKVNSLVQAAIEANNDFWLMNGYDIPKDKRRENYFFPALNGTKSVHNQFFPVNDKAAMYDIPDKKVLTAAQVDKILAADFFTVYKQREFNRKYLVQADVVRKYTASIIAAVK